jgi:hypothetical protein
LKLEIELKKPKPLRSVPSEKPNELPTPRKSGNSWNEKRKLQPGEGTVEVELVFAGPTPPRLRLHRRLPLEVDHRSYPPSQVAGEKGWPPSKLLKLLQRLNPQPLRLLLPPLLLEIRQLLGLLNRL